MILRVKTAVSEHTYHTWGAWLKAFLRDHLHKNGTYSIVVTVTLKFDLWTVTSNIIFQSKWTLLPKQGPIIGAALQISHSEDGERLWMDILALACSEAWKTGPICYYGGVTIGILERIGDFYCNMWSPIPMEVESQNCCQLHLMAVCLNGTQGVLKLQKLF